MTFKQPVQRGVNTFCVITEMAQVAANERQLCFLRIHLFDLADPFHCLVLPDIAAQSVNGIGWINDHTSVFQAFGHLADQPGLWILGMDMYEHNF